MTDDVGMIFGRSPGPLPDISSNIRSPLKSNLTKAVNRNQSSLSPTFRYKANKSVFGVNLVYIKAKEEAEEEVTMQNKSPKFNQNSRSVPKQRYYEPFNANNLKNKPVFGGGFH